MRRRMVHRHQRAVAEPSMKHGTRVAFVVGGSGIVAIALLMTAAGAPASLAVTHGHGVLERPRWALQPTRRNACAFNKPRAHSGRRVSASFVVALGVVTDDIDDHTNDNDNARCDQYHRDNNHRTIVASSVDYADHKGTTSRADDSLRERATRATIYVDHRPTTDAYWRREHRAHVVGEHPPSSHAHLRGRSQQRSGTDGLYSRCTRRSGAVPSTLPRCHRAALMS